MEHKGLLSGMKVLDLSRVLAAPYCGMMLADLGAEVIKIERPGKGDDARSNFPIVNGESAYYMNLNRNKRGIVLNLKSQAGKEVFRKLVAQSDVVLENYRPGVMDRLGLAMRSCARSTLPSSMPPSPASATTAPTMSGQAMTLWVRPSAA